MKGFITRKGSKFKFLGDAIASKVLKGIRFYGADDVLREGTMPDNGAVSQSLNAGGSYTIPEGYHNGKGKISANSLASQTDGTATAADILKDKTAVVDGVKITGTMATMAGQTVTPGTTNKTISCSGKKMTSNIVVVGDANLDPSNIKANVTMFGKTGTCPTGNEYVKRIFSQTVTITATGGGSQKFTLDYAVDTSKCIFLGEYITQGSNNVRYSSMTSTTVTLVNWSNSSQTVTFTIVEFTEKYKSVDKGLSLTYTYSSPSRTFSGVATGKFIAFCSMTGYHDKGSIAILDGVYDSNDIRCLTKSGSNSRASISQSGANLTLTVGGQSSYIYIHYYFVYFN